MKLYPSKDGIKEANELKNLIECATIRYNNSCVRQSEDINVAKTKLFLKRSKLVAITCDKSNAFTLMPLQSYNNRMQVILDGKEFKKYKAPRKNSKDPIVSFEDKVNKILLEYKKKGLLSDKLYHQFHKTGTQPPPQTHKKDSPETSFVNV